jgi:hypothetical protein
MGIIYIGRTGNNPLIPVPDVEVVIRNLLESIFSIRPRFKSFLVGHPLLILGIWLVMKQYRKWGVPLLLGGLIGQITMINTFSHIHTPLQVSILRSVLALFLGTGLGLLSIIIVSFLISRWRSLKKELS